MIGAFRVELVDKEPVMPVGVVTTQPDRSPMFAHHAALAGCGYDCVARKRVKQEDRHLAGTLGNLI